MTTAAQQLSQKQILVIDDMVESRSAIKRMLVQLGGEKIDTATDGDDAIARIQAKDYDLVISDYNLGKGKDGQQILEEARYTKRLKATSIFIMVTGENASDMVMGALEYEPDAYLTKPITPQILAQRLKRIINTKNIMQEMLQAIDGDRTMKAIELGNKLIERQPQFMPAIIRHIGPLYILHKEYNNAIRVYSMVLNDHYRSWARLGQAICMHRLGDSLSALALLKETLRRQPRYVQCYDWMARIYLSMEDRQKAQQLLEQAVSISPKAVLRQRELGQLAMQNEDWEVAANAFDQAVRLGRNSCHKNIDAYLNLADCAHPLLMDDSVAHRRLGQKVQRALAELQTDFNNKSAIQYAGLLAEARICHAMKQPEKSNHALNMAELMFKEMEAAPVEDALSLTSTMIQCGQHVKANDLLRTIDGMQLTPAQRQRMEEQMSLLDEAEIRQNSDRINAEGIGFYERGELESARQSFDMACAYPEAGISVILNAIQVRVSMIKQPGCSSEQRQQLLRECRPLFKRIGMLGENDDRYQRLETLKANFTRLLQEPAT